MLGAAIHLALVGTAIVAGMMLLLWFIHLRFAGRGGRGHAWHDLRTRETCRWSGHS